MNPVGSCTRSAVQGWSLPGRSGLTLHAGKGGWSWAGHAGGGKEAEEVQGWGGTA